MWFDSDSKKEKVGFSDLPAAECPGTRGAGRGYRRNQVSINPQVSFARHAPLSKQSIQHVCGWRGADGFVITGAKFTTSFLYGELGNKFYMHYI